MKDKDLKESDFINISWQYFSLHANQRIQIMNFYIILETFFITALATVFHKKGDFIIFQYVLCIAIIFFSFIFRALDIRTKLMIKYAERTIINIEQKYFNIYGKESMIFSIEEKETIKKGRLNKNTRLLSYSNLFNLIYIFFILIGILGIVLIVKQQIY